MSKAWALSASPNALKSGQERFILSGVLPSVTSVEWGDVGSGAMTNGSTIKLPSPFLGMTEIDLLLWRYKCQHEIGHESACNNHPHWKVVMEREKKHRPYRLLWAIANILSDYTQEKNSLGEAYGRDIILLDGRATWTRVENTPKSMTDMSSLSSLMMGIGWYDIDKRAGWNSYMDPSKVGPSLIPAWRKKLDACGDWDSMRNEEDVFQLALVIYELLKSNSEAAQKAEEADKAEAERAKKEGKGKGAEAGKGAGDEEVDEVIKSRVVSSHWEGAENGKGKPTPNVAKSYTSEKKFEVLSGRNTITIRKPVTMKDRRS